MNCLPSARITNVISVLSSVSRVHLDTISYRCIWRVKSTWMQYGYVAVYVGECMGGDW
jgi:hypothetical protein